MTNMGYSYKKLQGPDDVQLQDLPLPPATETAREELPLPQNFFHRHPKTTSWAIKMLIASLVLLSALSLTRAAVLEKKQAASTASSSTTRVPQVFQTTPELFAGMLTSHKFNCSPIDWSKGPTATGRAPFLAQSNPAPFGVASFVANHPLETAIPIVGNTQNASIFQQMGNVSPYFPNPRFVASNSYGRSLLNAAVGLVSTKCLFLLEPISPNSTCCIAMGVAIRHQIVAFRNSGQH